MQKFLSGLLNKLGFASSSQAANQTAMPDIHIQPDRPLSFGFKTNWPSSFQIIEAADYQSSLQPYKGPP